MSDLDEELLRAAETGDVAAVTTALRQGADVNARGFNFGRTALMEASMRSFVDVMGALLSAGADVNLRGELGESALICAASSRGGDSIRLLLANGADPKVVDRDGRTALIWMVDIQFHRQQDTSDSIKPLVDAGTDVNGQDETGETALMVAVAGHDPFDVRTTVLTALVENGADVNATDHNGETAMFTLVRFIQDAFDLDGGPDCIRILLAAGADPNARNAAGKTPLDVVHDSEVIDLLKGLGFTD